MQAHVGERCSACELWTRTWRKCRTVSETNDTIRMMSVEAASQLVI